MWRKQAWQIANEFLKKRVRHMWQNQAPEVLNEFVTRDEHELDKLQMSSSHVTNQKNIVVKKTNSN